MRPLSCRCKRLIPVFVVLAMGSQALVAEIFVFRLQGSQEVPPVSTPSSGGCMGVLDASNANFAISCRHNIDGATTIHIHRAPAGMNGAPVFDLPDPASQPIETTWTEMTAADIADLQGGDLYVNIHSDGRPTGVVRGQIVAGKVDEFVFQLSASQQFPPDVSAATGKCSADLNAAATELAVDCTYNVVDPTATHIHVAPAGDNGPVILDFGDPTSPISGTLTSMLPAEVAELAAGFFYVNVHSIESDTGEIRGQIGGPFIFTDGFESGDVTVWSATQP